MKNKITWLWKNTRWYLGILLAFLLTMAFLIYEAQEQPTLGKVQQQNYRGTLQYVSMQSDGLYTTDFVGEADTFDGMEIFLKQENSQKKGILRVSLYEEEELVQIWRINWEKAGGAESVWLPLQTKRKNCKGHHFFLKMEVTESSCFLVGMTGTANGLVLTYRLLCKSQNRENMIQTVVCASAVSLFVFALFLTVCKKRKRIRPERMFALLYVIFFIFAFWAVPIFNTPDEYSHFFRAYEISQGHLISQSRQVNENGKEKVQVGREFPNGLNAIAETKTRVTLQEIENHKDDRINTEQTHFYSFSNTALYAPLSYLPQALGIRMACLVTDKPIVMAYAGRICNSILIGLILFLSIRGIPVGKTLMAAVSLMPMALQAAFSLSADGLALAAVFAMLSFVLHLRYQQNRAMTMGQKLLLCFITALVCSCKIVYVPFCLLLFLIPPKRFGGKIRYAFWVSVVGAMILFLTFGWLFLASGLLVEVRPGVDTAEQIRGIFLHPLDFGKTFLRTLENFGTDYLLMMLGRDMGWLNLKIPAWLLMPYLGILAHGVLVPEGRAPQKLDAKTRILLGGCSIFVFLLIFVSLYGQWTAVGYQYIEGVQGRYFLPLLVPGFLSMMPGWTVSERDKEHLVWRNWLLLLCINLCVFGTLFFYASVQLT